MKEKTKLIEWQEKLTPEELKEVTSKAGKASVKKRREKKLLKEYLEIALAEKTDTGDYYTDITKALILKAVEGDTKAYHEIRDTLGQAIEHVELNSNTVKINITGEDE